VPQFLIELGAATPGDPPGRALLVATDEAATVELGPTSVTFLGVCLADDGSRRRRCASALDRRRLAEITELPGSFHLVVLSPDLVAVFGDAVGLRRIFYARFGDGWLVSDRADVLARSIDAPVDDQWLALWLVWPPPDIASSRSPWTGVDAVPPGGCLVWRRNQAAPLVDVYWTPPVPELAREDGAVALAEALTLAVQERVRRAAAPSLDLSGGKDTVALAFLADGAWRRRPPAPTAGGRILAVTLPSISADNDDVAWARAVAGSLSSIEHLVIRQAACPLPYDDLPATARGAAHGDGAGDGWLLTDHPSVATMHSARRRHLAEQLRRHGRGADHLAGYGGDEVLQATPAYLSALLRRHPLRALTRLRHHCALTGTPVWPVLSTTLAPGSHERWLRRTAADLLARRIRPYRSTGLGWATIAPAPSWLTDHALSLAADALVQAAAAGTSRLAADVGRHATLARIQAGAATARLHQQSAAGLGVRLHCPYFDRRVVEASLAVRPHDRTDPSAFKPLLDTALASTVPARFRARPTKSHYTEDTAWGLWRNRDDVRHLLADARLANRGLVDVDVLRQAVGRPREPGPALLALNDALSAERWLQAQDQDEDKDEVA
jgi:asparagine synthase (glutamine-hydrolysing)